MNSDMEGVSIASSCLIYSLIGFLIQKEIIAPSDVGNIVGDAEECLAGLKPEIMSPSAREYAKETLQKFGKIFD